MELVLKCALIRYSFRLLDTKGFITKNEETTPLRWTTTHGIHPKPRQPCSCWCWCSWGNLCEVGCWNGTGMPPKTPISKKDLASDLQQCVPSAVYSELHWTEPRQESHQNCANQVRETAGVCETYAVTTQAFGGTVYYWYLYHLGFLRIRLIVSKKCMTDENKNSQMKLVSNGQPTHSVRILPSWYLICRWKRCFR